MIEWQKRRSGSDKQNVIDWLWLNYYNDTLFAKGLISEADRNRMRNRIDHRRPGAGARDASS